MSISAATVTIGLDTEAEGPCVLEGGIQHKVNTDRIMLVRSMFSEIDRMIGHDVPAVHTKEGRIFRIVLDCTKAKALEILEHIVQFLRGQGHEVIPATA